MLMVDLEGVCLGLHRWRRQRCLLHFGMASLRRQLPQQPWWRLWLAFWPCVRGVVGEIKKYTVECHVERFRRVLDLEPAEAHTIYRQAIRVAVAGSSKAYYPIIAARRFLSWAQQRHPLVLLGDPQLPAEAMGLLVRFAGFDRSFFRHIVHGDNAAVPIFSQRFLPELVHQLGYQPEQCFMVSTVSQHIRAATAAGFKGISMTSADAIEADLWLQLRSRLALQG